MVVSIAEEKKLRIITVNLPETVIEKMRVLTKEYKLYPSRSELIRVAVREFLIKQIKNLDKYVERHEEDEDVYLPRQRVSHVDMRTIRFIRNMNRE